MNIYRSEEPTTCEWFALCANDVVRAVLHPILGWVPTCERCIGKIEAMGEIVETVNVEVVA